MDSGPGVALAWPWCGPGVTLAQKGKSKQLTLSHPQILFCHFFEDITLNRRSVEGESYLSGFFSKNRK